MVTKKWFVIDGADELGPLGPNGLRRLIRRGQVLPGTFVRREDHQYPIRADNVRGLFSNDPEAGPHGHHHSKVHGPYSSLFGTGWFNFAAMLTWVAVGAIGLSTALSQREQALALATDAPPPETAAFLGIGETVATVLFFCTGVLFCYWLWLARVNLPHLIHARIRFSPGWTLGSWFVPILNFLRPYQVLEEVDRLSAEAVAEGDASVRANGALLVPWWLCTLLLVALTATYLAVPQTTAGEVALAATLHFAAASALLAASATGAAVFLRITLLQERAHAIHPEPVQLHRVRAGQAGEAHSA